MIGTSCWNRLVVVATLVLVHCLGCVSPSQRTATSDSKLVRHSDAGRKAFAEGDLKEAFKKYDRALMRAWATDDPYESGTAAYNLAACLVSQGNFDEASDWLVDARMELCRAKSPTGNAWLLSAEIAMTQNRLEDATRFIRHASCTCPPCELAPSECLRGAECSYHGNGLEDDACDESCLVKLPGVGRKVQEKQEAEACQRGYQARIELARARLAAKQFHLATAKKHLAQACELSAGVCDLPLHAQKHDVVATLHDLQEHWLQAGANRDRAIKLLRSAGHYRELPDLLNAAAFSYQNAGRLDLARDRKIRSARIWLARGEPGRAWRSIRNASDEGQLGDCEAINIRLSLTAQKIQQTIARKEVTSAPRLLKPTMNHLSVEPTHELPSKALIGNDDE